MLSVNKSVLDSSSNVLYRSAIEGDAGKYYILEKNKIWDSTFLVISSRVGKYNAYTNFTKLNVNCDTMEHKILGICESDGFQERVNCDFSDGDATDWTTLITGSSKSDLVHFICEL